MSHKDHKSKNCPVLGCSDCLCSPSLKEFVEVELNENILTPETLENLMQHIVDSGGLLKKPDNWEEIKHGFTQGCFCKNCGHSWSRQLEWKEPAINSLDLYNYCEVCKREYMNEEGEDK